MKSRACCKVLVDTRLQIPTNRGRSKTFWDNDGYSFNRAVWNSSTVSATRSEPHRTASSMHDRLVNSCRRRQLATPRTIASCSPATGWEPAAREDTHFQRSLGAQSSQVETTDRERCILKAVDQSIITHTWFSIHEVRRMESMTISSHRISQAAEEQYFIMQCPASFLREIHVSHCPTDIWVCLTLFSHWCCEVHEQTPIQKCASPCPTLMLRHVATYSSWLPISKTTLMLKYMSTWSSWWKIDQLGQKLVELINIWPTWWSWPIGQRLVRLVKKLANLVKLVKNSPNWSNWKNWPTCQKLVELVKNWQTRSNWPEVGQVGRKLTNLVKLVTNWPAWLKVGRVGQQLTSLVKLVKNWPTWSRW